MIGSNSFDKGDLEKFERTVPYVVSSFASRKVSHDVSSPLKWEAFNLKQES